MSLFPNDPKTARPANRSFFVALSERSEGGSLGQPQLPQITRLQLTV
jgi:hypothetical protein